MRGTVPKSAEGLKSALLWSDSDVVIHELIHLAGRYSYSDQQLAMAVSQMPDTPEIGDIQFPTEGTKAEKLYFVFPLAKEGLDLLRRISAKAALCFKIP
jgi:hypothetical protein